jgi:hypothetical protein
MIGEVASSEQGGSKGEWITNALAELSMAYPQMRAFVWFDWERNGYDWPIETSASSIAAFARGIVSSRFTSNAFGGLGPGTIRPPS